MNAKPGIFSVIFSTLTSVLLFLFKAGGILKIFRAKISFMGKGLRIVSNLYLTMLTIIISLSMYVTLLECVAYMLLSFKESIRKSSRASWRQRIAPIFHLNWPLTLKAISLMTLMRGSLGIARWKDACAFLISRITYVDTKVGTSLSFCFCHQ